MSKVKKHCPLCGEITEFEESADAAICEKCGAPFITANAIEIEVDDGLVDAKCTNCGAALRVDPTKEAAICEYCGSAYIVKKAIKNYEITINNTTNNNYVADVVNVVNHNNYVPINAATEISRAYKLEKEKSKEEFKRDVLIALSAETDSPNDIANINILDIEECEVEAIFGDAHVDLSYTATIGYDRQEQYLDTVNEYDPDLKKTVQKTVVKTRTVTDWHPHSGQRTAEEDGFAPLDSKYSKLAFRTAVETTNKSNISSIDVKSLKKTRVEDDVIQSIKDECIYSVRYDAERDLPGDHNKDFNYSAACEIKELIYYKVPYYLMKYEYKGKQYEIGSIPCGSINFVLDSRPKSEGNIEDEAESASKPLKISETMSWITFGVICALALVLGFSNSSYWMGYIVLVPFALGITFMMLSINKYNTLLEKSFNDKLGILKENLKKSLNKHELEPLTNEEEKMFSLEDTLNEREFNTKKRNKKTWVIVLTSIVTVIMLLFAIIGTSNHSKTTSHSPETIEMSLTSYSTSQDSYYSYVDFNYSIKSKKYNLSSMTFTTHVYSSGKEVLSINSNLYSMNLSSGSTKSFSLQSKEYGTNTTTYSAFNKTQSYTYKFEITRLDFSDGESYYPSKVGVKNINNIIAQNTTVRNNGTSGNGSNNGGSGSSGGQTISSYTITTTNSNTTAGTITSYSSKSFNYGASVTLTATAKTGYKFVGWYDGNTLVSSSTTYTFSMPAKNITYTAKWTLSTYTLGSYPQTKVTNSSTISTLNTQAGTLPTSANSYNWTDYGYYINGSEQSYMWYQDITYQNNKYRGVYFDKYRPYYTNNSSSTSNSYQDDNGYDKETVYWFKWEPINWKVLTTSNNKALIVADLILDSQDYQYWSGEKKTLKQYSTSSSSWVEKTYSSYQPSTPANGDFWMDDNILKQYSTSSSSWVKVTYTESTKAPTSPTNNQCWIEKVYSNNYALSHVRSWLNDTFYEDAFDSTEKAKIITTTVSNNLASTGDSSNIYVCENTQDKIFLLSVNEVTNDNYGFDTYTYSSNTRRAKGSDYAKAQGLYVYNSGDYAGNSSWWLRSPYNYSAYYARSVNNDGNIGISNVDFTYYGVRPALWINL